MITLFLTPELAQTILWLGLLLIGLELLVFTVGILGVIGVGMVLLATITLQVGESINLLQPDEPAVLFLYLILFFTSLTVVWLIISAMHKSVETGTEHMVGKHAVIEDWNGIRGRVKIEGESWIARSHEEKNFKKDDNVTIVEIDKLTLWIE